VFEPSLAQFVNVKDVRAVVAIIGADIIENVALTWSCSASIRAQLAASKDRRSAEAVTELAVHLAEKNEKLEKRVSLLEDAILKSVPASDSMPLLADKDLEDRMSSADVHADLASKAIESAKLDEQRHRTKAICLLLRVCAGLLGAPMPEPYERASHCLSLAQLTTSEVSEILSSIWGASLLAFGYYGTNKMAFDGIRALDDAAFLQAMTYSLADAGLVTLVFAAVASYLYLFLGVRAIPTLAMYVKVAKMAAPFAATCVFVPIISLTFFLEHNGVDASLRFEWLKGGGNANATVGSMY
jgi:hypothetical protein